MRRGAIAPASLPSAANVPKPRAAPPTHRLDALEEVIVTATRREERAGDVPISMEVWSQEAITAWGVKNTADIAALTPGHFDHMATGVILAGFRQPLVSALFALDPIGNVLGAVTCKHRQRLLLQSNRPASVPHSQSEQVTDRDHHLEMRLIECSRLMCVCAEQAQ